MVRTAGGVKGIAGKTKPGGAEIVSGIGRKARTLQQHVADFARDRATAQALSGIRIIALEEGTGGKKGGKHRAGSERLISARDSIMNMKKQKAIHHSLRMG